MSLVPTDGVAVPSTDPDTPYHRVGGPCHTEDMALIDPYYAPMYGLQRCVICWADPDLWRWLGGSPS